VTGEEDGARRVDGDRGGARWPGVEEEGVVVGSSSSILVV